MRKTRQNFVTGLTSLIALAGVVFLLFRFGELDDLLNPKYEVTVTMNRAAGLRPGSPVELNGVRVGQISSITLQQDPEYPVRITAMIETRHAVPATAQPEISQALIGGSSTLLLLAQPNGADSEITYLPTDGSAAMAGFQLSLVEQVTTELQTQFQPLMTAMESVRELSDTYNALGKQLNEMFELQDEQDLAGGAAPNIRTAVARLNERIDQVGDALTSAQRWLDDEQLRANVHTAVTNATSLIEQASGAIEAYTRLAMSLEKDGESIAKAIVPVADKAAQTLEELRAMVKLATTGSGSIAEALNNPDLYLSLTDAANRLEQTLKDAQLLIQKIKSEGVRIDI